jgi:hypothetical protein
MLITLGFTQSDQAAGYSSFTDGYRIGAHQESFTIELEGAGSMYTAAQWAEEAFTASNHPGTAPTQPARAIQLALAEQVSAPLRALSVGDTVTVDGIMLACTPVGFARVDEMGPGDGLD